MGGSLLMAHRGYQCGAWGPARRRLRAHPGDVLERLVATKCPRMLLLKIPNCDSWADILIFVWGRTGCKIYLKILIPRIKAGEVVVVGGTAFVTILV